MEGPLPEKKFHGIAYGRHQHFEDFSMEIPMEDNEGKEYFPWNVEENPWKYLWMTLPI